MTATYDSYEGFSLDEIKKKSFNQWRMITADELRYILYERPNASKLRGYVALTFIKSTTPSQDIVSAFGEDTPSALYRMGFVVCPDNYKPTHTFGEYWSKGTKLSQSEWEQMEQAGVCMFVIKDWNRESMGTYYLVKTSCYKVDDNFSLSQHEHAYSHKGYVKLVKDIE